MRTDRQTPGGMRVLVSTYDPKPMPEPTDAITVVPRVKKTVAFRCGHKGPKMFDINLYGEPIRPNPEYFAKRKQCGLCAVAELEQSTVRCASCGFGIPPGGPVALYQNDGSFRVGKEHAGHGSVIGCMRMDCCPSGGFFAGHWDGKKIVSAFDGRTIVDVTLFRASAAGKKK